MVDHYVIPVKSVEGQWIQHFKSVMTTANIISKPTTTKKGKICFERPGMGGGRFVVVVVVVVVVVRQF